MNQSGKALLGSWLQAVGTIVAALGSTPSSKQTEASSTNLSLIGNLMQGTGNALIADSIDEQTLNKIGNQIQAIGNSTVIVGLIIHCDHDTTNKVLNIQGNLLQALGSTLALPELFSETKSYSTLISINGTLLQTIGNALQAIAGGIELHAGDAGNLNFAGSWIQAVGSVLQALVATKSSQITNQQQVYPFAPDNLIL